MSPANIPALFDHCMESGDTLYRGSTTSVSRVRCVRRLRLRKKYEQDRCSRRPGTKLAQANYTAMAILVTVRLVGFLFILTKIH